jgi:hypothetical protein
MDGSNADLIIIPIVAVILLAGWLVAVFHAASHPQWKAQRTAATGKIGNMPLADDAPAEPAHRKVIIPVPLPREPQPAAVRLSAAAARYAAEHPAA